MQNNDLEFLCNLTQLSEIKLLTLLEEDYDLLIDQLAQRSFYDGDFGAQLSFPLFTRLTIFRKAKDTSFSLHEKSYVADCVIRHYRELSTSYYVVDNQPLNERTVQFYLVLLGMFPEYVQQRSIKNGSPNIEFYANVLKHGLRKFNRIELAEHSDHWLKLLHDIKINYWH